MKYLNLEGVAYLVSNFKNMFLEKYNNLTIRPRSNKAEIKMTGEGSYIITDYCFIKFESDQKDHSYLTFLTGDNGDESIKFVQENINYNLHKSSYRTCTLMSETGDANFPGYISIGNDVNNKVLSCKNKISYIDDRIDNKLDTLITYLKQSGLMKNI